MKPVLLILVSLMGALGMSPANDLEARVKQTPSGPVLFINSHAAAPVSVFINFDTGPELREGLLKQIELAGKQGVNIVSLPIAVSWPQPDAETDFSLMDERMDEMLMANPKALALLRIALSWPGAAHGYERMVHADGTVNPMPSIHSEAWRRDAREFIRRIVRHLETKYPESVLGYHTCGQGTAEWFYDGVWEGKTPGFEPVARAAFRAWLKEKYVTDDALRKAWRDPAAALDAADVPTPQACVTSTTGGSFRDPQTERRVIDFFEFQNQAMADVAELMARTVREEAPHKLSLTFYGYHFDLCSPPTGLASSGHLAFSRLLASPYVDGVCSPVSYLNRGAGGGGYFMTAVDSVNLHGKLWIVEDDTRTHLCKSEPALADLRETEGVHARNFAHFFTRGNGAWWMDLYGQGWLNDEAIWQYLGKMSGFYRDSMSRLQPYRPEIAVIVDEHSSLELSPGGALERLALALFRSSWYRIGAPLGIYLLDDLLAGRVPPAKMTLMLNAYRIDGAQLEALRKNTSLKGSTVLWMYAPGFVRDGEVDARHVSEVTGITVSPAPTADGSVTFTGAPQPFATGHGNLSPIFAVTDPAATPLATYTNGAGVAVASKTVDGHTSIYSGVLQLPVEALRDIARQAGVHIYNDQNNVVMAGNGLVALHASSPGKKVIKLPSESAVEDLLTGEKFPVAAEFAFEMQTGDTRLLRLIPAP